MKKHHNLWAILLAILLCIGLVIPSFASNTGDPDPDSKHEFDRLSFRTNSYIQLREVMLLESIEGNIVSISVDIRNGGFTDIHMIDYWIRLKSRDGSEYSVSLSSDDEHKDRIPAQTSQTFTFFANVSNHLELDDLIIEFIEWNFDYPDYQRAIGTIHIPPGYTTSVRYGQNKSLFVGTTELKTSVTSFQIRNRPKERQVEVGFNVLNNGRRAITVPDYRYYLRTEDGLMYGLTRENESSLNIQPREDKNTKLKGAIPASIESEQWELVIVKPEGEQLELPIGFYELRLDSRTDLIYDDEVVPEHQTKELEFDGVEIETSVDSLLIHERNNMHQITILFDWVNMGDKSVVIPDFMFEIATTDELRYPMSIVSDEQIRINPRVTEQTELKTEIPLTVDISELELTLLDAEDDPESPIPLARYKVPQAGRETSDGLAVGESFEFETQEGKFAVSLHSIQRLPWEDQDIIAAEVELINRDTKSLPLLEIDGVLELDGVKLNEDLIHTVRLDQMILLQPNERARYIVYTKIPYTFNYKEVTLTLEELYADSESRSANKIVDYRFNSSHLSLPNIAPGETYRIDHIGQRSAISVRDVHHFTGSGSNLYYVELEVQNEEKRSMPFRNLKGYLKTRDDIYLPLEIQQIDQRIAPLGKSLLSGITSLPSGIDRHEMRLVLGETVDNGSEEAYVNAASFILPTENNERWNTFENMEIYPYTLTLNQLRIALSDQVKLLFQYQLSKDRQYQFVPEGHKLVIVLYDGDVPYEQMYEFESDLQLGTHNSELVTPIRIDNIDAKLDEISDGFEIRIYVDYDGYRKHIGTQKVRRFVSG